MLRAEARLPEVQLLHGIPPRPPFPPPGSRVEGVVIGALALALLFGGVVGCAAWSGWWARRQVAELEAEWAAVRGDHPEVGDPPRLAPPLVVERSFDEGG
jgi:hypothetical protein